MIDQEKYNQFEKAVESKTNELLIDIQTDEDTTNGSSINGARGCDQPAELLADGVIAFSSTEEIFDQSPIDGHSMEQTTEATMDELSSTGDSNLSQEDARPRTNSERHSNSNSIQNRIRKTSNSFLSKLHSSSEDNDNREPKSSSSTTTTNVSSSLASAFSSFSSFTSNFTLNPSNSSTNGSMSANSSTAETASTSTTTTTSKLQPIQEIKEDMFRKKTSLERRNLISLTKLIVKDLISSSISSSRTINDDCRNTVHLNNYFTLIDRVLKHGLKQNLLGNRSASLWNALDDLPKFLKESNLMSESVRSLTNTKTADGKIKAWMRLVMMQKKLPEYFNELLANKNVLLKDIYHHYAFMMNDEAQIFAGLIIGVNVIDCNFFVKDANFDLMDDIIDLSPYLRMANSYDEANVGEEVQVPGGDSFTKSVAKLDMEKMTAVLDQKNYLEEWNKRLESTVNDLKAKIISLEEQNSKLEMEAKLTEVRIAKLLASHDSLNEKSTSSSITHAIKNLIGSNISADAKQASNKLVIETGPPATFEKKTNSPEPKQPVDEGSQTVDFDETSSNKQQEEQIKTYLDSSSTTKEVIVQDPELQKQVAIQENELKSLKERASILEASYRAALEKIKVLERDLDIQTSMNADKDTTIKIYEKDIREKQAQVESLRTSLNEAKKLNTDLNERLTEASNKLKDRVKMVSTLQASLDKWKLENKTVATRLQDKQTALKQSNVELEKSLKQIEELKRYNERVNEELKKERESGHSSTVTVETQNARIADLTEKLAGLENELKDVKPYREQTEELNQRCRDYELSLEEIGAQLRESRLEVENLKENSAVYLDSQWQDSKQVKNCVLCQQTFSVTRRKHHCRLCGNVFCQTCSDNKMELASSAKPVRVCDTCHSFLLAKFVKSSAI